MWSGFPSNPSPEKENLTVLFALALTLVGLGAMVYAYQGVDNNFIGTRVQRLRFAGGLGMCGGLVYAYLSAPTQASSSSFQDHPFDPAWLAAGILVFGFGAGTLVFSLFYQQHLAEQASRPRIARPS